jgi:predicted nucleic acid-binding protein
MIAATTYFVDTSFWIGLMNPKDQHYPRAFAWYRYLSATSARLLTSEPVLWEVLNAMSAPPGREHAAEFYRRQSKNRQTEIVGISRERTESAFAVYEARRDQAWSLTDCFSFEVMRERNLFDALTSDHHFEQAGFAALLLRDPPTP